MRAGPWSPHIVVRDSVAEERFAPPMRNGHRHPPAPTACSAAPAAGYYRVTCDAANLAFFHLSAVSSPQSAFDTSFHRASLAAPRHLLAFTPAVDRTVSHAFPRNSAPFGASQAVAKTREKYSCFAWCTPIQYPGVHHIYTWPGAGPSEPHSLVVARLLYKAKGSRPWLPRRNRTITWPRKTKTPFPRAAKRPSPPIADGRPAGRKPGPEEHPGPDRQGVRRRDDHAPGGRQPTDRSKASRPAASRSTSPWAAGACRAVASSKSSARNPAVRRRWPCM